MSGDRQLGCHRAFSRAPLEMPSVAFRMTAVRRLLSPDSNAFKRTKSAVCLFSIIFCIFCSLGIPAAFAVGPVTVTKRGTEIQLGNDYLERTIDFGGGVVRTTSFLNKVSGRVWAIKGDEFEVRLIIEKYRADDKNPVILTSNDFHLVNYSVHDEGDGGKRVVFQLSRPGLNATLVYELKPQDFYMRKWIRLENAGSGTPFIDWIAVEKNCWYPRAFSLGGFGQPLLAKDLFLGLEYPSSVNTAANSLVTLGYYVGMDIPHEGFKSEPAVFGVSAEGRAHTAFMNYINAIRVSPPHPVAIFDTWEDIPSHLLTSAAVMKEIAQLKEHLVDRYGVRLDSFLLDAGWDSPSKLWGIDRTRFPGGFESVASAVRQVANGLGLWLSPMGGFGSGRTKMQRIAVGIQQGMEVTTNHNLFCVAGPNYSRYLRDVVVNMEKEYGINVFKFDGVIFTCNQPDQGYPLGIYSREAGIRNWIATLKSLRAVNPRVFLGCSTGFWLSPWWLRYCNSVDYGGRDFTYSNAVPTLTPRQASIDYSDAFLYHQFKVKHLQFPISSLDAIGIHKGRFNFPQVDHESVEDWADGVVNCITTGIMKIDLYISPGLLTSEDWNVLGRSLRWATRNANPLFDSSTMVLGDPAKGKPYGYMHVSPAKTILALRNPSIRPATISLKLDTAAGFEPTNRVFEADVIYPYRLAMRDHFRYGDMLNLTLDGYEQCVIELRPVENLTTPIVGVRYSPQASDGNKLNFRVYGAKGKTEMLWLNHINAYSQIRIDGAPVKAETAGDHAWVTLHFGGDTGREDQPMYSAPSVTVANEEQGSRNLTVRLNAEIPPDFQGTKVVLLLQPAEPLFGVKGNVQVNRKPSALHVYSRGGQFYSLVTNITSGNNLVQFEVTLPVTQRRLGVRISGWLRAKRMLASRELTLILKNGQGPPASNKDLLPVWSGVDQKTYFIFQQTL